MVQCGAPFRQNVNRLEHVLHVRPTFERNVHAHLGQTLGQMFTLETDEFCPANLDQRRRQTVQFAVDW